MSSNPSQGNDPLMALMGSTQIDSMYTDTAFTQTCDSQAFSQACSEATQSNSQGGRASVSKLTATAQRLNEFAESLADPNNELDPFYQTVLQVYEFFDRKLPFLLILAKLHANSGNVAGTVKELAENYEANCQAVIDDNFFPFDHTLVTRNDNAERYFNY